MAILRSVVDVNNGNTGWTKSDVLDALETVFANLGFNGGTTRSGVPIVAQSPNGSIAYGDGWSTAARNLGSVGYTRWYYDAISQGTSAYRMLKKNFLSTYTSGGPNSDTDEITMSWDHGLTTGDPIHWAPGETDAAKNINGLTLDTVYYVIVVDNNTIKLAANATDANNGVAIDLLYGNIWSDSAALGSELSYFRDIDDAQFDNRTIQIATGDQVYFNVNDTSGGDFSLCGGTDNYDGAKLLSDSDFRNSYAETSSANLASTSNITSGTLSWSTYYWRQTENERDVPDEQIPLAYRSLTDNYGIKKYIYASDTHATMKGEIVISPKNTNNTGHDPYWKVTIPANGGRSELKLRVYRDRSSYEFHPQYVKITSIGTGWTEGETFTIPGDQTGGLTPEDDINFGIRSPETSTGADDGVCQLYITTLGSGSNFYQKSEYGAFAVMKVVNDASKDYGTSYYSFSTSNWSDSYMYINSGNHWEWMNKWGTKSTSDNATTGYGEFGGVPGLDRQNTDNFANRANTSGFNPDRIQIASTSTPTAYPMSIRVYRAQAPQDTNFAVIQFCQTINGSIIPYGQFTIHKGATFGSNVWDLDHVFLGTYTEYTTSSRSVHLYYRHPGYYSGTSQRASEEPVGSYSVARESSYGYRRDPSYGGAFESQYMCNIDTDNEEAGGSEIMTYYRNSTYDQRVGYSVNASVDYYKPIKGLPLAHNCVPCPYYLPDDFVMLQFSTTPGATVFRPGDTITVSASEVYEVILAGYQTSQNGLDNVENNSSMGMLFLARTT